MYYKSLKNKAFLMAIIVLSTIYLIPQTAQAEEYEYDENGRVITVTHDDGSYTEYEYDKNGNIISVISVDSKDITTEEITDEKSDEQNQVQNENKSDSISEKNDDNKSDVGNSKDSYNNAAVNDSSAESGGDVSVNDNTAKTKAAKKEIKKLKKGTIFEKGNLKYKVTKAGKLKNGKVSGGKVKVVGLSSKGKKKSARVTISDSVTYKSNSFKITVIDNKAFKGKTKIKTVTIGKNVTKVGKNAFSSCKNLTKLTIKGKNTKFGKNAFKKTSSKLKAYVPASKFSVYKKRLAKAGVKKVIKSKKSK